ncbi:hypothetical protein C4K25_4385 [Pseudomonas chlororaphis]|nr:hypothetical protein C4K25_4385 [Pseudomonas chlororaphis]
MKILINLQVGSVRVKRVSRHPLQCVQRQCRRKLYLETSEVVDPV